MDADEYQQRAAGFAMYPAYSKVLYPLLGACGELGELVAKFHDAMWPYGTPVHDGQEQFRDALLAMIGVGQRCETLKKQVRGGTIDLTPHQKDELSDQLANALDYELEREMVNETADCAWYLSALLSDLGVKLSHALEDNLQKLTARQQKNQIHSHQPDSKDHKE